MRSTDPASLFWCYERLVSKAFTSEETPEFGAVAREPPKLRPGEVRYVTPEGRAALVEELERLRLLLAETGQLPEGERLARRAEVEARVMLVEGTLAALTVLGPERVPEGKVGFGSWVTVEDQDGRRTVWRLVGPDEVDPRHGLISAHSPVGRALLGREVGELVEVQRPDGPREYEIVEVGRRAPAPE